MDRARLPVGYGRGVNPRRVDPFVLPEVIEGAPFSSGVGPVVSTVARQSLQERWSEMADQDIIDLLREQIDAYGAGDIDRLAATVTDGIICNELGKGDVSRVVTSG